MKTLLLLFTCFISLNFFGQAPDLSQCDNNNDGFATFNLSSQTAIILGAQSPAIYSVRYFQTMTDAMTNANPIAFESSYMNVTPSLQTIYARLTNNNDDTFTLSTFDLKVLPTPQVDDMPDVMVCNSYTLPPLGQNQHYFTGPGGSGTMLSAGTMITASTTIYIFASSGTTIVCSDESSFIITISSVQVPTAPNVVVCDHYALPALSSGNYYTAPGGNGNMIPVSTSITSSQTIYIFATNGICSAQSSFMVTVNPTPNATLQNGVICAEGGTYLLNSGLPANSANFSWSLNGTLIPSATSNTFTATMPGTYTVTAATFTTPSCFSEASAVVTLASQSLNVEVDIADQNITVITSVPGNYTYQIGASGPQGSNVFENLPMGAYLLTVTDSCGNVFTLTFEITTPNPPTGATSQTFVSGQTLADITTNGQNVKWYANDAVGAKNMVETPLPMNTPLVNGATYYATQTINGAESTTRLAVTVTVGLGVSNNVFQDLSFYPNPVKNILGISNMQTINEIVVVNLLGQTVFNKKVNDMNPKVDLSNINAGIYLVKIICGGQQKTLRIIKE